MPAVHVNITKYVDDWFPGFVRFELTSCDGTVHEFTDKVPVVSLEALTEDSDYPRRGALRCSVVRRTAERVEIDTSEPDGVASSAAEFRFSVHPDQIVDASS